MRSLIAAAYLVGVLVVSVQRGVFAFANDFAIFRSASHNLARGADLYLLRPEQAQDLFKYSPTFAVLFAPFAIFPPFVGLALWNVTGALLLFLALQKLLPAREALGAQAIVYLAMLRNAQSAQSNSLIAALMIFAFMAMEQGRWRRAAGYIGVGAAIKVFPLVAGLLAVPHRAWRRFAVVLGMVGVVLAALPLLMTDVATLEWQYRSWWSLHDAQRNDVGQSAMAVLAATVHLTQPQWLVQLAGTSLLVFPLVVGRRALAERCELRLQLLASILLYAVLFNHKAEAASYVIAMAGIGVWWGSGSRTRWRDAVAVLAVSCTNLPSADFMPVAVKAAMTPLWRGPIVCTVVWVLLQAQLLHSVWRLRRGDRSAEIRQLHTAQTQAVPERG